MTRVLLFLLVAALTGCAQPSAAPSPDLDPELGVGPTVTESEPTPVASPTATAPSPEPSASPDGAAAVDSSGQPVAASPSPNAAPSSEQPRSPADRDGDVGTSRPPVVLLAVADAAGDHGARGPAWADLRSAELVEVGNDLRVTLRFSGDLPDVPPQGEVPLVGIDIGDAGYQLFVEGGGQSWAAYLDTPEGFVEYPGTFELAGQALVLQVPFSAVGSPTRAPVRAFTEWSRDSGTLGMLNPSSEDHLDGEPHTFDRAS